MDACDASLGSLVPTGDAIGHFAAAGRNVPFRAGEERDRVGDVGGLREPLKRDGGRARLDVGWAVQADKRVRDRDRLAGRHGVDTPCGVLRDSGLAG
jgi:hypothetical protein